MESFVDQLADDVIFNSPVTTYYGRADVEHLLTIISGVLDRYEVVRELTGPDEVVSIVSGQVAGHAVDGVVDRRLGPGGEIVELTLMLRPLKALMAGVELMAQALAAAPLPSARG
jgi:hypothetical protein